jgi:mRNA-degrading endonuclease HigB of HigAB toxin-antitoxin module
MNIVGKEFVYRYAVENPGWGAILADWMGIINAATWRRVDDIYKSWRNVEVNGLRNESTRVVFCKGNLRIIATVQHGTQTVYILKICLAQEYSVEADLLNPL